MGRGFSRARAKPDALPDGVAILYGLHTVQAALDNPRRRIRTLYATENAAKRLTEDGVRLTVTPQIVRPDEIARRLSADAVHNGLLAEADPLEPPDLSELEPEGIVLVLDQITDPHNVGAILRSAAAFGVKALVTTCATFAGSDRCARQVRVRRAGICTDGARAKSRARHGGVERARIRSGRIGLRRRCRSVGDRALLAAGASCSAPKARACVN